MTIEDLWSEVTKARGAIERFDVAAGRALIRDEMTKLAKLQSDASFALQTYDIAHQHGLKAAMMFKLSDGNIDPRSH